MSTPTTPIPTTARASFALLATLCAKLQPEGRAQAVVATMTELADLTADLPLTPLELADAFAACSIASGTEPKDVQARRKTCSELAELLGRSLSKVAGQRPPTANAQRVWSWIAEAFTAKPDALPGFDARAKAVRSTAAREHIELIGRAALGLIGGGKVKLRIAGLAEPAKHITTVKPDADGFMAITGIVNGEGKAEREYTLPTPLRLHAQSALHKVGHPWMLMGLVLADASHAHAPEPGASGR